MFCLWSYDQVRGWNRYPESMTWVPTVKSPDSFWFHLHLRACWRWGSLHIREAPCFRIFGCYLHLKTISCHSGQWHGGMDSKTLYQRKSVSLDIFYLVSWAKKEWKMERLLRSAVKVLRKQTHAAIVGLFFSRPLHTHQPEHASQLTSAEWWLPGLWERCSNHCIWMYASETSG